jgi:hypothetical protein
MVDHHTLMRNFFNWYKKEETRRGYCPGNWKWIITPVSPTASPCYLQLNKMTEYKIKPVGRSIRVTAPSCTAAFGTMICVLLGRLHTGWLGLQFYCGQLPAKSGFHVGVCSLQGYQVSLLVTRRLCLHGCSIGAVLRQPPILCKGNCVAKKQFAACLLLPWLQFISKALFFRCAATL